MIAAASLFVASCDKSDDPETPQPKIITGSEHLGRGYDASQHYAMEVDVKSPVLDLSLLSKHVDTQKPLFTQTYTTYGSNLTDYVNKLMQKCVLNGKGWGFSASVKESFTDNTTSTLENSFYTSRHTKEMAVYRIFSDVTIEQMKSWRSASFLNNIQNQSAEELVKMYGTHVITGYTLGGTIEISITALNSTVTNEQDFALIANVGYQNVTGKIDGSLDLNKYNKLMSKIENYSIKFLSRGGSSSAVDIQGKDTKYDEWDKSLEEGKNQVLVEFTPGGLIPLSMFVDNPTLAQEIDEVIAQRMKMIDQKSGYLPIQVYLRRIDSSNYKDSNGYCKWKFCTGAKQGQPDLPGQEDVSYIMDTYNIKVANFLPDDYLVTDAGNCTWTGTQPYIDFKDGTIGAHDTDNQKAAVSKGELHTKQFKVHGWEVNTMSVFVDDLVQYNSGSANDEMGSLKVDLAFNPATKTWTYTDGNNNTVEVFDRNIQGAKHDIVLTGYSKRSSHSGESVQFIFEYEWKEWK